MIQAAPTQHFSFLPWAERSASNRVYPLSIAEGLQSGTIFADLREAPTSVLFWHYCGFAYLSGAVSDDLLDEIASDICRQDRRRMVLITDDDTVARWLRDHQYAVARRIEYEYGGSGGTSQMPLGIRIERIDGSNLPRITGRIVPAFSWEEDRFLRSGFGYAAFEGDAFCGVAFSAAVSSSQVDIGVEVRADHQGRGIATALVHRMCREALALGKKPVWAHAERNLASMRTALRCEFVPRKMNWYACLKQAE